MKFLFPSFLFALFSLAIPVIIHLFNFRKFKRIYFSNIRFLKEVKQDTQSKAKLKHLLVLACRLLAVAFLVFAFAQPYIPVENKKTEAGEKAISIYVDNSFSMDAINKNGTLLDEAKKRALEIVKAFKPTDKFQLLTSDFEGKHQRLVTRDEFIKWLDEVKVSSSVKSISEVYSRQADLLAASQLPHKKSFIISDFQKKGMDISTLKNDTSIQTTLVALKANEKNNLFIDSCWFVNPVRQLGQADELHVRIRNTSDKEVENAPVKLFLNESEKTPASFSVDAQSSTEVIMAFVAREPGVVQGRVQLDDYPVTFDDQFFFSYTVKKNISVLCIQPGETAATQTNYIQNLFGKDSLFVFSMQEENKLNYSSISNFNLIVLNELKSISSGLAQELKKFISGGGSVVLFPSVKSDLVSYNEFLSSVNANTFESLDTASAKIKQINQEDPVFSDVFEKDVAKTNNLDLPVVKRHFSFSQNSRTGATYLLRFLNGISFVSYYTHGKGKLYLCASPLSNESTSLPKHALFVPLMYKIGVFSQPNYPLFYTVSDDGIIEVDDKTNTKNEAYHILKSVKDKQLYDVIPEFSKTDTRILLNIHDQIKEAGNYFLINNDSVITGLAFNYNRKESDLSCFTPGELEEQLNKSGFSNFKLLTSGEQTFTQMLQEADQGIKLWKWCILLVLIFLAAEVVLLRWWKS